jgi:hypothetical protein
MLEVWYWHNWQADQFARGAYSYTPIGNMDAFQVLSDQLRKRFFLLAKPRIPKDTVEQFMVPSQAAEGLARSCSLCRLTSPVQLGVAVLPTDALESAVGEERLHAHLGIAVHMKF